MVFVLKGLEHAARLAELLAQCATALVHGNRPLVVEHLGALFDLIAHHDAGLGGLGSRWGVILAAAFMVMLPEKFQVIQEYRYLIYSAIVLLMILYRPAGLLPRRPRTYTGRA